MKSISRSNISGMVNVQNRYDELVAKVEQEKADRLAKRQAEAESLGGNISVAEYIAKRQGKEYVPSEDIKADGYGESYTPPTMKEFEEKYNKEMADFERRKAEMEQDALNDLESMRKMSMAEYVAKRSGQEYIPTEDLGKMSMADYIKARKG